MFNQFPKSELPPTAFPIRTLKEIFNYEVVSHKYASSSIYISTNIRGEKTSPETSTHAVKYLLANGAEVPSAHVVWAHHLPTMLEVFYRQTGGLGLDKNGIDIRTPGLIYEIDMGWVDAATELIGFIDGASFGVGAEATQALLKPERGLPATPVLLLASSTNMPSRSRMAIGAHRIYGNMVSVAQYRSLEDIEYIIDQFLTSSYEDRRLPLQRLVDPEGKLDFLDLRKIAARHGNYTYNIGSNYYVPNALLTQRPILSYNEVSTNISNLLSADANEGDLRIDRNMIFVRGGTVEKLARLSNINLNINYSPAVATVEVLDLWVNEPGRPASNEDHILPNVFIEPHADHAYHIQFHSTAEEV